MSGLQKQNEAENAGRYRVKKLPSIGERVFRTALSVMARLVVGNLFMSRGQEEPLLR